MVGVLADQRFLLWGLAMRNVRQIVVTPDVAETLLAAMDKNRPFDTNHCERLTNDMRSGKWVFNGDTITVCNGHLIDGQHRLRAVRRSGVTIDAILVEINDDRAFKTKDSGKKRSPSDALGILGHTSTRQLSGASALLLRFMHPTKIMANRWFPTNSEIVDFVNANPDVVDAVKAVGKKSARVLGSVSAITACYFLFHRIDADDAGEFLTSLLDGVNLARESPIYVLRQRMIADRAVRGIVIRPEFSMGLIIKAWNYWRSGVQCKHLRFVYGGENSEKFPVPQ